MVVTIPPDALTLAPGKSIEIPVKVERRKGFTGKVPLVVIGAPEGVNVTAPEIDEKQSEAKITLKAEGKPSAGEFDLVIAGRVDLGEQRQVLHVTAPVMLTVKAVEKKGEK